MTFEYAPEELGLKAEEAAKVKTIPAPPTPWPLVSVQNELQEFILATDAATLEPFPVQACLDTARIRLRRFLEKIIPVGRASA